MKTYYVYNYQTDEFLAEVKANSVIQAEIKAAEMFNLNSKNVYAFTEKDRKSVV